MNFKLIFLILLFTACGVKRPPTPENTLPSVYEKYSDDITKELKKKKDK